MVLLQNVRKVSSYLLRAKEETAGSLKCNKNHVWLNFDETDTFASADVFLVLRRLIKSITSSTAMTNIQFIR